MLEMLGIIAYESRSYGAHGQKRETFTRHIYTGGAVEGSATLCGRTITEGSARFKWIGAQAGLDGRRTSEVDCLRCLNEEKLRAVGYQIRQVKATGSRVFLPLLPSQTRQDAQESPSVPEEPPSTTYYLSEPPARNQAPFNAADGRWMPPTSEELQGALERLLNGHGNEPRLRESVESGLHQIDPATGKSRGRTGRFLSVEDWQIVAWAANAWTIANHLQASENYGGEMGAGRLLESASRRAASIWRE